MKTMFPWMNLLVQYNMVTESYDAVNTLIVIGYLSVLTVDLSLNKITHTREA